LRERAIDAALSGVRPAAARFGIGDATAIVWVRRAREVGDRLARKQGQPRARNSIRTEFIFTG
jgi:transposase